MDLFVSKALCDDVSYDLDDAGLIDAGDRGLKDNFRYANALDVEVHLVVFATLELLVAGTLEGLVSPIPTWPLGAKVAVMGATAVFLVGWLSLGREGPNGATAGTAV